MSPASPTSYGSALDAPASYRPNDAALPLRRLLDAGAVVFGKTNPAPSSGIKGVSDSLAFGRVNNPWDTGRNAGGSSGGSAAAVAAGVVPMAGGNDGGGSLRIPAACCGLFALKPSRGRISNGPGINEVWFGACSEGVLTRSVRDTALALDVLCGPEPGDPFVTAPPAEPFCAVLQRPLRRLRIAFSTVSPVGTPVDPQAADAVRQAAGMLARQGHAVEEAAPPVDGAAVADALIHLYFGQVPAAMRFAMAHGARRDEFELLTQVMATLGASVSAGALTERLQRWNVFARTLADFHTRHDVWMAPALARSALPHGALDMPPAQQTLLKLLLGSGVLALLGRLGLLDGLVADLARQNLAPYPFTQLANLTGTPAMSVPLAMAADGLPLGVHFGAAMGDEATLLQLAAELEQLQPWFDRLPALAGAGA